MKNQDKTKNSILRFAVIAIIAIIILIPFAAQKLRNKYIRNMQESNPMHELLKKAKHSQDLPKDFVYYKNELYVPIENAYVRKEDIDIELGRSTKSTELKGDMIVLDELSGLGKGAREYFYTTKNKDLIAVKAKDGFGGEVFVKKDKINNYIINSLDVNSGAFYKINDLDSNDPQMNKIVPESILLVSDMLTLPNAMVSLDTKDLRFIFPAAENNNGAITFKINNKKIYMINLKKSS